MGSPNENLFITPQKNIVWDVESRTTHYIYSKTNLIINVREGDSKYDDYLDDNRYRKMSVYVAAWRNYL